MFERECVSVCVYLCERETERERVCVICDVLDILNNLYKAQQITSSNIFKSAQISHGLEN